MKPITLKKRKIRLVTMDDYWGMEEWYMEVISCPNCKCKLPANSNYCSGCGVELKLCESIKNKIYAKKASKET